MKTKQSVIFIFTLFLLLSTQVLAQSTRTCRNYFGSSHFWDPALNYKDDVLRTRGGRLFLTTPPEPADSKAWGLIIKEQMPVHSPGLFSSPYHFFQYVLPHKIADLSTLGISSVFRKSGEWRFAPFQFLEKWFLDKPTEALSKEILYTKKRLSLLMKIPIFILLSFKTYDVYDKFAWRQFDNAIEESILSTANSSPHVFEELALYDYRYEAYKSKLYLASGQLNMETIVNVAAHSRIYYEYYKLRDQAQGPLTFEQEIQAFSNNPLFSGITDLFEVTPGYSKNMVFQNNTAPFFTDEQKSQVFKLRHLLLYQYQALDLVVFNPLARNAYEKKSQKDEIMDSILNDPIIKNLIYFRDMNVISQTQTKYIAQKYFHTLNFLFSLRALGIQYFLDNEKTTPLSEETIQLGTQQEIRDLTNN